MHKSAGKIQPDGGETCADKIQSNKLFDVVSFEKGNFVEGWKPPEGASYHVILW